MLSKFVVLCALVAMSQARLLPAPAHYSPATAISSQSILRHDQPQTYQATPVHYSSAAFVSSQSIVRHDQSAAKLVAATPVYHATPVAYHAVPAVTYHTAPVAKVYAHHEEEIAYPKYEYTYSVADGHTGDNKSQQESRDGDVVKGSYSFHEADGSIRTVQYSADDHNGFNAVVHNTAPTAAPVVVKAAAVLVKAAPALAYYHH